ncbi:MAG: universal stress protein [Betaproteobacteria bacterium]|nr:universal stress protein [Betaproteobacteria bacterium]
MSPEARQALPAYRAILLATDSSDHANRAALEAAAIASLWGAQLTGIHVYAAKLHDLRFRQMEGGLPAQFRDEHELERQRDVHDSLISRGLSIISDSYLDQVRRLCSERRLRFSPRAPEGKNYRGILQEANTGAHDLLILGALGLGAVQGSRVGSVAQRVARGSTIDTLMIRDPARSLADGPIAVAIDGSPLAYGGLLTALALGLAWRAPVKVVAAFDPYYHYVAFNRIAGVLSEQAGKVFRFKEQEKLHEEIIDSGLAKIYEGHLQIARSIAADHGIGIETELLDGKPHEAIERWVRRENPSLLVIGKTGIHADDSLDIGGNAENLLRNADCAVLLSRRPHQPSVERLAEVTTSWTREAEAQMERVPDFARDMARMAILRYAQERGHTVITARIAGEATAALCPHAARAMGEIVAAHDAGALDRGAGAFQAPAWSEAASAVLASVADRSLRDNLRLRAEKRARQAGAPAVEAGHVHEFIRDPAPTDGGHGGETLRCPYGAQAVAPAAPGEAALRWSAAAEARMTRVPAGVMRELTRSRIEAFARRKGIGEIAPELIDEKYAEWQAGSQKQAMALGWDPESRERIERIPEFVRGMVIKEVERCAREMGLDTVTPPVLERARGAWTATAGFHSEFNADQYSGAD